MEEDIGQEAEDFVSRFKTCSNVRIHTFWEIFKWYWNDIGGLILLLLIIAACLIGIIELALKKQKESPIEYEKIDGHECHSQIWV